jgi:hypothetical protein
MHLVLSYNPKKIVSRFARNLAAWSGPRQSRHIAAALIGAPAVLVHALCGSIQAMGYELQACLQRTLSPLNGTASS